MKMSEQELRELDAWIAEHVMGFGRIKNNAGCFTGHDGKMVLTVSNWTPRCPHLKFLPTTDPAAAMMVLEKCASAMKHGIVGIGSPTGNQSVASTLPKESQDWVVGMIGKPSSFDVEVETLPLAICLFAKKLFSK